MIRILLSARLGELRMTQAELARKTGIRPTTINDYYHELTDRVNLVHLYKICKVLQCDLTDLLYMEDGDDAGLKALPVRKRGEAGEKEKTD